MHDVKLSANFHNLPVPCAHWSVTHRNFYQNENRASLPRMIMYITCSKNISFKAMRGKMHFRTFVLSEAWSRKLNAIGSFIGMCRSNTKLNIIIHLFFSAQNWCSTCPKKNGIFGLYSVITQPWRNGHDFKKSFIPFKTCLLKISMKISNWKMLKWQISLFLPCAQSTVKLCTQVIHFVG